MKIFLLISVASYLLVVDATILTDIHLSRTPEVRRFQQYIQIDTVTGKNLSPAVRFWKKLALNAKVKITVHEFVENFPVVVIKWPGRDSSLSSLMLNTHMDVVPADIMDGWTYPPFSAHIDENGDIYGRGTQEIKSVSMQHYEALLRLKANKITLLRDVYMVLTPAFQVDCFGPSAVSSELVDPAISADGSCGRFYLSYAEYRTKQFQLSQKAHCSDPANITVINFVGPKVNTMLSIIPSRISLFYDSYLRVNSNVSNFETMDGWTYPPFSAHIDENGDIYGRGTQEIKSVSMQHYEALLRLKANKITLLRDVYMVLTPAFQVDCFGPSAVSSELVDPAISADGSCGRFYLSYAEYRTKQFQLSQKAHCSDPANITVINFVGPKVNTMLSIIPSRISLFYDSYLRVNSNVSNFETMVKKWQIGAGDNVKLKTLLKQDAGPAVKIDECNPYWTALQKASEKLNIPFDAHTAPEPNESSYVTAAGYPAFGISPLPNTENLIHAINERINVDTFLKGITVFEEIFKEVANIPADLVSDNPRDYLV